MTLKEHLFAMTALVAATGLVSAQEVETAAAETQETVRSIQRDMQDAQQKWMNEYRAADPADRGKLLAKRPRPDTYRKRMWKVVKADPTSAGAGDGVIWIVQNRAAGEEQAEALGLLQKHHLGHARIGTVCQMLQRQVTKAAEDFLRAVVANTSDAETKGLARYSLGKALAYRASSARLIANDEKMRKSFASYYGKDAVDMMTKADPDELEKDAERLLETCLQEHGDIPYRGKPLSQKVESDLFELRNLSIGKTAPDIEAEDIDGVTFKLSDYRGKVVMLDFWGDW